MKQGKSLDGTDAALLRLLDDNPRATVAELARAVGMSGPAVKERLLRVQESGLLRFRMELSPKALGYHVMAFVRVRPLPGRSGKLVELARTTPEVTACHRVTGEDCFVLEVHVCDIAHLERLLDQVLAHGETTTAIVQSTPVPRRNPSVGDRRQRRLDDGGAGAVRRRGRLPSKRS